MTGPGEVVLIAIAIARHNGAASTRAIDASTRSLTRFTTAAEPRKGDSHSAITGSPATVSTRAWMRSNDSTSGTKYTEAVVSCRLSTSLRMRGCQHGSAQYTTST